ncbi:MAG: 3-phosphoshikimate 1-carboxyvinyltransferase [Bdellovibrionales bacterium]|nr:3-phosphoshikimate 1-carboxyvinyltransferase [Bdellovibrionales bacterium]
MDKKISPSKKFHGTIIVPGDKSMSHRSLMFGAIAKGKTTVRGLLRSADVMSTKSVLVALGAKIQDCGDHFVITGTERFSKPAGELDCGNSGTTMRLMMGLLANSPFECVLTGDVSLSKRPMKRVSDPLSKMGASIRMKEGTFPPVHIVGGDLSPIQYELPVASAQVKSAIILAALRANGKSVIRGRIDSRDHTERMLQNFGVNLKVSNKEIWVESASLVATEFNVPGDPSTAAFPMAGAALIEGSDVTVKGVSLNPTRTGFIQTLKEMGAQVDATITSKMGEPIGDVRTRFGTLKGVTVPESRIPSMIDEIPMLAILATQAQGVTKVTGAEELRVKESDRIESVASNLRAMGIQIETLEDGFVIEGPQKLRASEIVTHHDHRIAMAFAIAGLVAEGETVIHDSEVCGVSYPEFFKHLEQLSGGA